MIRKIASLLQFDSLYFVLIEFLDIFLNNLARFLSFQEFSIIVHTSVSGRAARFFNHPDANRQPIRLDTTGVGEQARPPLSPRVTVKWSLPTGVGGAPRASSPSFLPLSPLLSAMMDAAAASCDGGAVHTQTAVGFAFDDCPHLSDPAPAPATSEEAAVIRGGAGAERKGRWYGGAVPEGASRAASVGGGARGRTESDGRTAAEGRVSS